jgi:hypothetical protein
VSTYFRLHPEDEDPEELLEPENQVSKPWGGADHGRCDKCGGSGRTMFSFDDQDYEDECPACKGSGRITESERRGISVFPDRDWLYRYMVKRDTDIEGSLIVELEGERSADVDFDADEGALLVFPTRIMRAAPPDRERLAELKRSA